MEAYSEEAGGFVIAIGGTASLDLTVSALFQLSDVNAAFSRG